MSQCCEIVIPVYGALPLLMRCLQELRRYRVVVVDDASPPDTVRGMDVMRRKYKGFRFIHHDKNLGFIEACHSGVSETDADRILFLNSDTIPNEAAINSMCSHDADIVGCRLLFPTGSIQHAGVARNVYGIPYHPFMHLVGDTPHACRVLEVNAVTGAAMLVRREAWDALGGFDRRYGKGVFEDVDFCWRAKRAGMSVIYDGTVSMVHVMHGSKISGKEYIHDHGQENLEKLLKRFGNMGSDEEIFYGRIK